MQKVLRQETRRWHIKSGGQCDLLVCVGDHPDDAPCEFHRYRYVPEKPPLLSTLSSGQPAD